MRYAKLLIVMMFCIILGCGIHGVNELRAFDKQISDADRRIFGGEEYIKTYASVEDNQAGGGEELYNTGIVMVNGTSRLSFTPGGGDRITVDWHYGFSQLPKSNEVPLWYNKSNVYSVSVMAFPKDVYTHYKNGALCLFAAILAAMAAVLIAIYIIIADLVGDYKFYKRETRIYGRDISGTKIELRLKLFTIMTLAAGVLFGAFALYRFGGAEHDMVFAAEKLAKIAKGAFVKGQTADVSNGDTAAAAASVGFLLMSAILLAVLFFTSIYNRKVRVRKSYEEQFQKKSDDFFGEDLLDEDVFDNK